MDKKIFVYTRFNSDPFHKFYHISSNTKRRRLTEAWMSYRMELFMKYTLSSLKQQTDSKFDAWVIYDHRTERTIFELLARYDQLPPHIQFVNNIEQYQRMSESLGDAKQVYIANLDSDDMYHQDYIQRLRNLTPRQNTVALINQKGYIWELNANRLYRVQLKSPSFFTLIYNRKEFLSGRRYDRPRQDFALSLPHQILPGRNFIITLHEKNTVSRLSIFRRQLNAKNLISDQATVQRILKQYKAVP